MFFTAVASIDTSGISMFEEVKKNVDRKGLKVMYYSRVFSCLKLFA